MASESLPEPHARRLALAVAVTLLVVVLGALWELSPPAPAGLDTSPEAFSAERARAFMAPIFGEEVPHPIGSEASAEVRAGLLTALRQLGLEPEEQRAFVCRGSVCGWVVNLIAVIPGTHSGARAVLLSAHHDSVPAGPGIGDDASGVGIVLESARAILAGPPLRDDLVLLIDDGEEVGLLGAQAFVDQHPLAARVEAAVNTEARGSRGISRMFETKGASAWMIRAYAPSSRRGQPSSLSAAIYERMPNDTDLTVFGEAGMAGLNFAFMAGVEHYHAPTDDFAHLDFGTVQQQGDNVLAAVRALASVDNEATGELVYHPVLGVILRMPEALTLPAALLLLAGAFVLLVLDLRARGGRSGAQLLALLAVPAVPLAAAAGGYLVERLVQAVAGSDAAFVLHPGPRWLALGAVTLAALTGLAALAGRRCHPTQLRGAVASWLAGLALLVALVLPGASLVFLIVALAAAVPFALEVLARACSPLTRACLGLVATFVGAKLLVVLDLSLGDAFGFGRIFSPVHAGILALALLPLLGPLAALGGGAKAKAKDTRLALVTRRYLFPGALALALLLALLAGLAPLHSAEHTLPMSAITLHDRSTGRSEVAVEIHRHQPSASTAEALGIGTQLRPRPPWALGPLLGEGTPALDEQPQGLLIEDLELESDASGRRITGRLRSGRGSSWGMLLIPEAAGPRSLSVSGAAVETRRYRWSPDLSKQGREAPIFHALRLRGLPAQGVVFTLELEPGGRAEVEIWTVDTRLHPAQDAVTQALLAARPKHAGPLQTGDRELVLERFVVR